MNTSYPIRFSDQIKQHLKALRKKRRLTQAQVGVLIGVSQARIAEIESNPGLVSVEQMLQLFSALGVTLVLQDADTEHIAQPPQRARKTERSEHAAESKVGSRVQIPAIARSASRPDFTYNTSLGAWTTYHLRGDPNSPVTGVLLTRRDREGQPSAEQLDKGDIRELRELQALNPDKDVRPTSRRNFVIRQKKGSW